MNSLRLAGSTLDLARLAVESRLEAGSLARPGPSYWLAIDRSLRNGGPTPTRPETFEAIIMSERIVMRTGEALVEGAEDYLCAEPEVVIGELDGPVGHALANLIGDQVKGHTRVFAILSSDVQVRPATVMVSKVTVKSGKYTNILMGTVQAAIAHGVLDAVRAGDIPRDKVNDLGIIYSVWLDPAVLEGGRPGPQGPLRRPPRGDGQGRSARRCATSRRSTGCWRTRTRSQHYFHELGLKGEL